MITQGHKSPHSTGDLAEFYQACVDVMHWLANTTGTTYEEINIIVFIIVQPSIIIMLLALLLNKKRDTEA